MNTAKIKKIEIALISFVWIVVLATPVLFREDNYNPILRSINNQLEILIPALLVFLANRYLIVPHFLFRKKLFPYIVWLIVLILLFSLGSYYYDIKINMPAADKSSEEIRPEPNPRPPSNEEQQIKRPPRRNQRQPRPVAPFANVIVFSVLLVGFDTGLMAGLRWIESENEKVRLEKENVATQLLLLRNQISPHFFMNTLNNIYSLIESDKERSRQAVMKLSKLMRYLLYENQSGKVPLSREFEFIKNYTELMKLRFTDDVEIKLILPESFKDTEIPVLLFISYLENAFKYGTSYEHKSIIEAKFEIDNETLLFICRNSKNVFSEITANSGIGLKNNHQRLDLIYKNNYNLTVNESDDIYEVKLKIPLA